MKNKPFSLKARLKSFKYAFNGLKILIKNEHNSRIHLLVTICVIAAGFILNISKLEWIVVVLTIGFVFTTEIINSAIEYIADFISPERNDLIKSAKDLAAGAVLVSAISAVVIGIIIFLPKIMERI